MSGGRSARSGSGPRRASSAGAGNPKHRRLLLAGTSVSGLTFLAHLAAPRLAWPVELAECWIAVGATVGRAVMHGLIGYARKVPGLYMAEVVLVALAGICCVINQGDGSRAGAIEFVPLMIVAFAYDL
jgi:hypothetical protein